MIGPAQLFKNFSDRQLRILPEGGAEWRFKIPQDIPYVDGHFPNHPVLPAVAILDLSIVCVSEVLSEQTLHAKNLQLINVVSAKFLEPVRPGEIVDVLIHAPPSLSDIRVLWTAAGRRCADLRFDLIIA